LFFYKKDTTLGIVWMLASSIALQDSMFGTAHWLLAYKYKTIANKIPLILKKQVPPPPSSSELVISSFMISLNILTPLLEMAFLVPFNNCTYVVGDCSKQKEYLQVGLFVSTLLTGLL